MKKKGEIRGIYSTNLKKSICMLLNLAHNAIDCKELKRCPEDYVERYDFYDIKFF